MFNTMKKNEEKKSVGQPLRYGEETKHVGFRLPASLLNKVDASAKKAGRTRSAQLVALLEKATN